MHNRCGGRATVALNQRVAAECRLRGSGCDANKTTTTRRGTRTGKARLGCQLKEPKRVSARGAQQQQQHNQSSKPNTSTRMRPSQSSWVQDVVCVARWSGERVQVRASETEQNRAEQTAGGANGTENGRENMLPIELASKVKPRKTSCGRSQVGDGGRDGWDSGQSLNHHLVLWGFGISLVIFIIIIILASAHGGAKRRGGGTREGGAIS